jgi:C_GCAxxG_C_C family probable redox protein
MAGLRDDLLVVLRKGYHCSQALMLLSLEQRGLSNPLMVRALGGLALGMFSSRTCGALTGSACVIASYFPREEGEDEPTAYRAPVHEMTAWFKDQFGSTECLELVENDPGQIRRFCPILIEKCFEKIMSILEDLDIDPSQ